MIFVVPVVNLVRFQGSGMNALELRVLQIPEGTQDLEEGAFADCSSLVEAGSERKRRRRRARRFEDEHDRSGVRLASLYQLRLLCHQLDPPKPMELGVREGAFGTSWQSSRKPSRITGLEPPSFFVESGSYGAVRFRDGAASWPLIGSTLV